MPAVDLTPYDQAQGSTSDGTKFTNLIAAIQAVVNALDDANISPTAAIAYTKLALTGKLVNTDLSAAAAIAISKLAGYPSDGSKALFGDGTWATVGASNVGTQLDYAQITASPANVTATTEGTAVAQITGASVTYDGTKVKIDLGFAAAFNGVNGSDPVSDFVGVVLRDSTVVTQVYLGRNLQDTSAVTVRANTPHHVVSVFDTPVAGAHTYKLAAFVSSAANSTSWKLVAGLGGTGNLAPAYLRVTKA